MVQKLTLRHSALILMEIKFRNRKVGWQRFQYCTFFDEFYYGHRRTLSIYLNSNYSLPTSFQLLDLCAKVEQLHRCFVLQNFRIATKSGNIFSAY